MPSFKRLLAKSAQNPDAPRGEETLPGHTANVLVAAETLLDQTADAQLAALGLSAARWRARFRAVVLSAAFCHDLGKANDQFQAMVRRRRTEIQAVRHEALLMIIKGYGEAVQYSVFRCRLSRTQLAGLRWELARILDGEDSLLIVGLCGSCVQRIHAYNRREDWKGEDEAFAIV
jgi:CRISPR-associated protein Cas2